MEPRKEWMNGIFAILTGLLRIASIKHASCIGSARYDSQGVSFANVENERVRYRFVEPLSKPY